MATKERKRSKSESEGEPASPSTTPAKRKADVEELEVDLAAPEPPSKKAKRALKKGKSLSKKTEKDNDDDLTKDDADEEVSKDGKPTRSEHAVWIGNLRFTITPTELKEWLVSNSGGSITDEAITRIKLPLVKDPNREKGAKPYNKGFAYVDFSDVSSKVAAIALSETEWLGRKLLIKDSTSFEGRPKKEQPPPVEVGAAAGADGQLADQKAAFRKDAQASSKIFVGNMSFQTKEEDVYRQFEKCGEIEFVKVATFEDSGKCKGYGWVKFKEPEAAAWAVKGFVKIKEAIETEDDFKDSDDDSEDEEEKRKRKAQEKKFNTRKWYVNRMFGRELKLQIAEDDHVRYKKRFGKDGTARDGKGKPEGDRPPRSNDRRSNDKAGGSALKESDDIAVARLTGAVVKSTGTKVTFD